MSHVVKGYFLKNAVSFIGYWWVFVVDVAVAEPQIYLPDGTMWCAFLLICSFCSLKKPHLIFQNTRRGVDGAGLCRSRPQTPRARRFFFLWQLSKVCLARQNSLCQVLREFVFPVKRSCLTSPLKYGLAPVLSLPGPLLWKAGRIVLKWALSKPRRGRNV